MRDLSQLTAALRQHARPIVIEDQELAGPFVRLLRARQLRLWGLGEFVANTMSYGIDQSYGANVEAHWYVGRYVLPGNVQKVSSCSAAMVAGRLRTARRLRDLLLFAKHFFFAARGWRMNVPLHSWSAVPFSSFLFAPSAEPRCRRRRPDHQSAPHDSAASPLSRFWTAGPGEFPCPHAPLRRPIFGNNGVYHRIVRGVTVPGD
jgi:hypothetical protein